MKIFYKNNYYRQVEKYCNECVFYKTEGCKEGSLVPVLCEFLNGNTECFEKCLDTLVGVTSNSDCGCHLCNDVTQHAQDFNHICNVCKEELNK